MAHPPEMGGFQFQADEKKHQHHAEFSKMHDILSLAADKAEEKGADDDAPDEIAQDRPHSDPFGNGDEDDRRGQIDQGIMQKSGIHDCGTPVSESSQSFRNEKVCRDSTSKSP